MPLNTILTVLQVILSILLIGAILLQNRGAGLGQTFGGEGAIYHTKRGLEKRIHQATIALAVAFLTVAVLQLIL